MGTEPALAVGVISSQLLGSQFMRESPSERQDGQAETGHVTKGLGEVVWNDPLAANEARMAAVPPHTRDPLLA
jgi:hypothetical protein